MEIKDIQANTGNIDIVFEVVNKEEPRSFEKFGKTGRVCNAKVKDESGEVKMTLWNEDIDKINVGDKVHLQNGWCSEFKGEKQVSAGKFGKIEVVEQAAGQNPSEVFSNDPAVLGQGQPGTEGAEGEGGPEEGLGGEGPGSDEETTPVEEEEFVG